jgi:HlyD family secretion protein
MITKRRMGLVGAAAVAGLLLWWVFRSPALAVPVGVISEGPLRRTVDEMGTTRVRAHTDVNAPVAGRWVPRALQEGDVVRTGTRLGVLYPAPADAASREQMQARLGAAAALVREAETRVATARTALEEARRTRTRVEALGAAGGVSPQDVERARDAASTAEMLAQAADERLRAARFDRQQAAAALAGTTGDGAGLVLVAPLAGTVLTLTEPHERVVPAGARLLEVGDPRDLEVIVPLLTADAVRVREGAIARLTFGGDAVGVSDAEQPGDTVVGRVVRVEQSAFTRLSALGVEEQRVNVVVAIPATVHLGDHFRADVRITVWEAPRVLRVPASALVRDGDRWSVWRVVKGRAQHTAISLGERGGEFVEVRGGLAARDTVVLFPGAQLREGAALKMK